jgi:glycosyltransferase involved in cell wall biosynthesis
MQLLYITNKPLYPIIDGGCKAMAQMLSCLLHLNVQIDHICFSTKKHPFERTHYPQDIVSLIQLENIQIDTQIKPFSALKSLLSGNSYNISRFENEQVTHLIQEKLRSKKYDVILLESLYTTPYLSILQQNKHTKIILRTHNVEFTLWEQRAKKCFFGWKKWYLNSLARNLKRYEIEKLNSVDAIFSITENDLQMMEALGIRTKKRVIPVALSQTPRAVDDSICRLFFIGSMNWQPNIDAVAHFVQTIYPEIKKHVPEVELHLAGSYMGDKFPTDLKKGIHNHGFAENLNAFMRENGILVLPIQSGSGVRVKLLEAMALGIPVVSSEMGAMGLADSSVIKLAKSDTEMIQQTVQLLKTPQERKELGESAWNYVHKNYSIASISNAILHEFKR